MYSSKLRAGVYITYTHPENQWCRRVPQSTNPKKVVNRLTTEALAEETDRERRILCGGIWRPGRLITRCTSAGQTRAFRRKMAVSGSCRERHDQVIQNPPPLCVGVCGGGKGVCRLVVS